MAAVRATTHSNSAKMGLAMKRRFWEEDEQIFGGHLYSNLPIGDFSYPSTGYFSRKGVLLGLYVNGGQAGNLIDQPIAARVEHVLMHSSKVHPQIRQEFESAYSVWWKNIEYSRGGYANARRGQGAELSKMENRLLIGSAATTPYSQPDWQEGAVSAGWQALTTLHERAMRG
jgi:monoamine oxidase